MIISSEVVVVKYLSNVNINVGEVICIEQEKIKEIEKQVCDLLGGNALTVGEIIYICETVKTTTVSAMIEDTIVSKYRLKKVQP